MGNTPPTHRRAVLVLEDGRSFYGRRMGAIEGEAFGEAIFNTSMTGYQEIITDPSYAGQIVAFTAPQIGNYGVARADGQAERPVLGGVVIRELSPVASNWRSEEALDDWLRRLGVVGITEVDTRALTRHLRERGAMRAIISDAEAEVETLRNRVIDSPGLGGRDLASTVSTAERYEVAASGGCVGHVAVIDFGVKRGILSALAQRGLRLTVLPAKTDADELRALKPDALFLSNGPGDPAPVASGVALAKALIGELPIFGICLGHQILALALGAKSFKMRFGHHGGNHPVRDLKSEAIWITAQNHSFAIEPKTLPSSAEVTHLSLYDGSLEGFALPEKRLFAVQFHPEGSPGPNDPAPLFDRFVTMIRGSA